MVDRSLSWAPFRERTCYGPDPKCLAGGHGTWNVSCSPESLSAFFQKGPHWQGSLARMVGVERQNSSSAGWTGCGRQEINPISNSGSSLGFSLCSLMCCLRNRAGPGRTGQPGGGQLDPLAEGAERAEVHHSWKQLVDVQGNRLDVPCLLDTILGL